MCFWHGIVTCLPLYLTTLLIKGVPKLQNHKKDRKSGIGLRLCTLAGNYHIS
jgi:hypothetical protein